MLTKKKSRPAPKFKDHQKFCKSRIIRTDLSRQEQALPRG